MNINDIKRIAKERKCPFSPLLYYDEKNDELVNIGGKFNIMRWEPEEVSQNKKIAIAGKLMKVIIDDVTEWRFGRLNKLIDELEDVANEFTCNGDYTIDIFKPEYQEEFRTLWKDFNGDPRVKKILHNFINGKITHKEAHNAMCQLHPGFDFDNR